MKLSSIDEQILLRKMNAEKIFYVEGLESVYFFVSGPNMEIVHLGSYALNGRKILIGKRDDILYVDPLEPKE